MKRLSTILILTLAAAMFLTGCGSKEAKPAADDSKVICTVNGEEIHEKTYNDWYMRTMALSMGIDLTEEMDESTQAMVDSYRIGYLTSYAGQRVLIQEAVKLGVTVNETDVEAYVKDLQTSYNVDDAGFTDVLKTMGFTPETIRDYIREQMMIQGLYEKKTESITQGDITAEAYYEQHPSQFTIKEQRTVRHILVETEDEAKAIIQSLDGGADFTALVKEKSKDAGSVESGGVIGPFDTDGNYVQEFIDGTFSLAKVGDYTKKPVKTAYGYHIIVLDEITPASTKTLEEVRSAIEDEILWDARDAAFEEHYNQLIESADIKYSEGFDPYAQTDAAQSDNPSGSTGTPN